MIAISLFLSLIFNSAALQRPEPSLISCNTSECRDQWPERTPQPHV